MATRIEFNHFPQIAGQMEARAGQIVAKASEDIEANWKANIQAAGLIDTGTYLGSVSATETGPTQWEIATNLTDPPYPIYLELGTSRGIPAHGVATRAAETVRPAFVEAMRQLVEMSM